MDFLIDSNVLIAFLKNTDSCHKKALNLIHSLDRFSIVEYSLAEVSTILLLKESKEIAKTAMKYMFDNKNITIIRLNNEELTQVCNNFPYKNSKLSFVDLSLLFTAQNRDLKLVSFDEELMKAYEEC